jgi:hypothetical protein
MPGLVAFVLVLFYKIRPDFARFFRARAADAPTLQWKARGFTSPVADVGVRGDAWCSD